MDEKYINDLYSELGGEEAFGKYEDFVELISNDDSYIQDFHSSFGESTLGSFEDFKGLVKKKDDTASAPPTEDATTTLVSEEVEETTPSGSSALSPEQAQQYQWGDEPTDTQIEAPTVDITASEQVTPDAIEEEVEVKEIATPNSMIQSLFTNLTAEKKETDAIPGKAGHLIRATPIFGDFIDDVYRSVTTGFERGQTTPEAMDLLLQGKDISKETLERYIKEITEQGHAPVSQEMQEFNKTIQEEGDTFYGTMKALAENPSITALVMIESLASMANTASATAATATIGTGAVGGAAAGGPGGAVVGLTGSLPFAFAAAGGTLETAMSFTEFLQEELDGKEFNEKNIRAILEDQEALNSIRNRALARGATIGVIDALGGKLATSVGAKILGKGVGRATKAKAIGATTGIEALSGGAGEAAARKVVGQEMSMSEIILEAVGETPGATVTIPLAFYEAPQYKVNGAATNQQEVKNIIETSTPEELSAIKIDVKNDKEMSALLADTQNANQKTIELKEQFPDIPEDRVKEIVDLEVQSSKLEGSTNESSKLKKQEIQKKIKELLTKTEEDAIQEPSTESVDVREQARDGEEVGVRDTQEQEVTEEVTDEVTEEVGRLEELIEGKKKAPEVEVKEKVKEKVKVFRGRGKNYAETENEGFDWVATDKATADEYSSIDESGNLTTEERDIDKPENVFELPYKNPNQYVTGENIANHFRKVMNQKIKKGEIKEEQWREIKEKINEYEKEAGDKVEMFHTKINKPKSSKLASSILSDLGYDAISIKEGGKTTYGLIKKAPEVEVETDAQGYRKGFEKSSDQTKSYGYKVMTVGKDGKLKSGADSRISLNKVVGEDHSMPGKGIYITNDPNYAKDYYSSREDVSDPKEVLIKYEFDQAEIKDGSLQLNESQAEIGVSKGKVVEITDILLEEELQPTAELKEEVKEKVTPTKKTAPEVEVKEEVTEEVKWEKTEGRRPPRKTKGTPMGELVRSYEKGEITLEEYNKKADELMPTTQKKKFTEPTTQQQLSGLRGAKKDKINNPIKDGAQVGLRIDIPLMQDKGLSAVTIHPGKGLTSSPVSYRGAAVIENVEFKSHPSDALKLATEAGVKSPTLARMAGNFVNIGKTIEAQNKAAKELTEQAIKEGWTQVGVNPSKHSYFYDRATGKPLKSADRVVQVGDLVYAENAKTTDIYDKRFLVKGKTDKEGKPLYFRKKKAAEIDIDESFRSQEEAMTDQMNKMEISADEDVEITPQTTKETVDVGSINKRGERKIETVKWSQFKGLPFMFSISDMLRIGDVKNPFTGNPIKELYGGFGFNALNKFKDSAWANVSEDQANDLLNKAKNIYSKNKEQLESWWKKNPKWNGLVPMAIVKMGSDGILSNEALARVGIDNIKSKFSDAAKKKGKKALQEKMQSKLQARQDAIKSGKNLSGKKITDKQVDNYKKQIREITQALNLIKSQDDIVGVLENIQEVKSLAARQQIQREVFYGNLKPKKTKTPGAPGDGSVALAMLEGKKDPNRIYLNVNELAQVIKEPATANIPHSHIVSIVGVDVLNPGVQKELGHPNYSFGLKGKPIGMLKNPIHVADAFSEAYANVQEMIIRAKKKKETISETQALHQGVPTQQGLNKKVFEGAIAREKTTQVQQLLSFLNKSFPTVNIFTNQETFDTVIKSEGVKQYVKNGEVVYGLTMNGDIYINPQFQDFNTPIHEMGHIWVDFIQTQNPKLYAKGKELVKKTEAYRKALKELGNEEQAVKEAMATLIGNKGESITNASLQSKFKNWLTTMWQYVQEKFPSLQNLSVTQVEALTMDEFLGGAVKDILSGEAVSPKYTTKSKKDVGVMMRKGDSLFEIIKKARDNNFSEAAIKDYLVRVRKFSATEVKDAMKVDVGLFQEFPTSFGNIEGGLKAGMKLFNRVTAFMQNEVAKNKKRKEPLSNQEIIDATLDFLEAQPEYKAEADTYKVKGETKVKKDFSTQQAEMMVDLQKSIGIKPTKTMAQKLKDIRNTLRQRMKGAKDLNESKRLLKNFIRQTLPDQVYSKSEVVELIRKIKEVTPKNLPTVINEIVDIATTKNVKTLQSQIKDILGGKYARVESGRKKYRSVDNETRKRIEKINEKVVDPKTEPEKILDKNAELMAEFQNLSMDPNQTNEMRESMVDLQIAMDYNASLLMDDNNIHKLDSLQNIETTLDEIVQTGRSKLKEQLEEAHQKYLEQLAYVYEDVTGEVVDPNSPDFKEQMQEKIRGREATENKKKTQGRVRQTINSIMSSFSGGIHYAESLQGLMDSISTLPGKLFGGRTQEMVTDKTDAGTRKFKARKMFVQNLLEEKMTEIYGKKWRKVALKNTQPQVTSIYRNKKQAEQLIKDIEVLKKSPTKNIVELKKKQNQLDKITLIGSQNEFYYIYNQAKDPANLPGLEKKYGPEYKRVLAEIESHLDPQVKEWADWQVDVLFPSLYEHYNETYKKIYRTDMPWNKFYAGRIYREGVQQEALDMLSDATTYKTSVGGASTKVRMKNKNSIKTMDGNDVLFTYLNDMEYFAAMAEPMRDINKIFTNEYLSKTIEDIHGSTVMRLIKDSIDTIAKKGRGGAMESAFINGMTNVFVASRLGINPVVMVKQLTSFITYGNDIGYANWIKNSALLTNKKEVLATWKEVAENSVYIQDRYNTPVQRAIETYSESSMQKFVPKPAVNAYFNFLMATTKAGDKAAIYLGGLPNYRYYKAEYKKNNPNATEQEAIDYAIVKFEKDTKDTQQSSDLQDKDYWQTKGALARSFNLFLTTPKQYFRKEIIATRNLYRKLKAWDKNAGKGSVGENMRTLFVYHVIMPVFFQWVAQGLPGILRDIREEDDDELLWSAILGNLNAIFILGDLAVTLKDYMTDKPWVGSSKNVPILQMISSLAKLAARASSAKSEEKQNELWGKFMLELATFTTLPAPTIEKMVKNYAILLEGDVDPREAILRLFLWSDYQIEGPQKKKKEEITYTGGRTRNTRATTTRTRTTRQRQTRARR